MLRELSRLVFVVGVVGCTVNGKPVFGGGSTAPAVGPAPGGAQTGGAQSGGTAGEPTPVVSGPAPAQYAWCAQVPDEARWKGVKEATSMTESPDRVLPAIAQSLCHPERDSYHGDSIAARDQIEATRQAWMQKLGMTEADWATDFMEWNAIEFSTRNASHVPNPKEHMAWSKMGPVDQFALIQQSTGMGTPFTLQTGAKFYIADALNLTEAGRLAFIQWCVHTSGDDAKPVEWAVCQADIDAFDRAKFATELRNDKSRSGADKMFVRFDYAAIQAELATHPARVKALLAKDEAYGKLFQIAKDARQVWTAGAGNRAGLLSLMRDMDDARETNSKKASKGCSERAWTGFKDALAKTPRKRFEGIGPEEDRAVTFTQNAIGVILQNPDLYLAAAALVACEGENADFLVKQIHGPLRYWPGFRGPRTAAITAVAMANLELDQRGEKLELPDFALELTIGRFGEQEHPNNGFGSGIIASAKDNGDTVTLTLAKTSEMQSSCTNYKRTNRISQIDTAGNIIYEGYCLSYKSYRVDTTPGPFKIAKRYAGGLDKGKFVRVVGMIPEGVWPKSNSPTPTAAWGIVLKE